MSNLIFFCYIKVREEFSGTHSNIYAVLANNTKTLHNGDEESKLKLS